MNKQKGFWFILSIVSFLCSFAIFDKEQALAKPIDEYDEYEHVSFSSSKWSISLNSCGGSVGDACLDGFPGYSTQSITQTYNHRKRYEHYYWDTHHHTRCTSRDSEGHCTNRVWVADWSYSHTTYSSWVQKTTSKKGTFVQTPRPGIPDRYDGNMGKGLWKHESYFTDPRGWYGNAPRISDSDTKIGYSAWVKQVEELYINAGQGGQWTYEYQNPATPVCNKRYGNDVVRECGHHATNPGLYGKVESGSVYNHNSIKVFYYYKDPYTYVTEDTRGTKTGSISDNYTTRWWLQDVAIQGTSKYAGLDKINPYTSPASFWEIYGGEKRQFQCYAYFYTDPRDGDVQERISITDAYEHSWRTNRTGEQGAFVADASKPNEGDSYFNRDTRWIGNGRYNVTYKNPRANNSSLYWNWQNDSSRILAPSGDFKENTRETTDRKHPLENRGQYYMMDVLYDGPQELNCDMDISWYKSGNIPYMLTTTTAYRDLTLNGSAPHRNIKRNPQPLVIHGVKDIDLLISGTFYKHKPDRAKDGTDQVIVYNRKVETISNGADTINGVGETHSGPLRIEDPSPGAVPKELKDLYFMKGQWYSFEIEVEYQNGKKKILNGAPEAHWTADPWILGQSSYKKETGTQQGTLRTMMPYNGLEHQVAHNGIHNVHFEWFDNIYNSNGTTNTTPSAQEEITISGILAKDAVGIGFGTEPGSYNTIKYMMENKPAHRTGWSSFTSICDNSRLGQIDPETGRPMSPWKEEARYFTADSGRDKIYNVTDPYYKEQIIRLYGQEVYNKAAAAGVKLKYQTNTKVSIYSKNHHPLPCNNGDKGFFYNNEDFYLTATFTPETPTPTTTPSTGGRPGKTSFDFQFKAAEIESLDIYNEQDELGPTKLNTGNTHQFRAIMTFNAGGGKEFEYDWTKYMNLWGVDNYTVEKVAGSPGKFKFPKGNGIYEEHKRAGSEEERVERVIFAVWFDDILNYVNFTNTNTNATNPMTIYNVSQHWDAFGDTHIVQLKDDCKDIELYVEKCPLPKNSWRINIKSVTPTNFTPEYKGYTENPYFHSFDFPVTGTSNGTGRN